MLEEEYKKLRKRWAPWSVTIELAIIIGLILWVTKMISSLAN